MTYVYVARAQDFVKVGVSAVPLRRTRTLTNNGGIRPKAVAGPAVLIHSAPGDRATEKRLHGALREYRVAGEWFRAECLTHPSLREFLAVPASFGSDSLAVNFRVTEELKLKLDMAVVMARTTLREFCIVAITEKLDLEAVRRTGKSGAPRSSVP